jgi:tRNA pseudouridine32 synthase / 23S rRNA pseudouridine746 synthase
MRDPRPPPLRRGHRSHTYVLMTPEETRARLLFRDGLMLVLDKPAGIAVHRGPKGGASLEDDFDALRFGLPRKPALAHRLDRETAGCLVLGRHHKALERLGLLFKQGRIAKTYWAVVAGAPDSESGSINLALGRLDDTRGWWMKVDPQGQPSLTLWRVMGRGMLRGEPIAWLELEPRTGRTHQLRVHCASQGWPILGDAIYGSRADVSLQLLARKVVVPLSNLKPPIEVEAPAPPHMMERLAACGFEGERPRAERPEIASGAPAGGACR